MVYIARVLLSGRQKIATAMLLAALVGFLAFYPRVTEALLAFCLGGEIPGTNIVVSPDMMLVMVILVLVVSVTGFGIRIFLRRERARRNFMRIPVKAVSTVTIP